MLFSVNVKILNMLKNSKWIPSTVKSLENLLNTKLPDISINLYLITISKWYKEVYTRQHGLNKLLKINNALLLYYQNVYKYSDYSENNRNCIEDLVTTIDFLKQFNNNYKASADCIFSALAKGFSPICKGSFHINLKRDLTQKEIESIYVSFLNSIELLYDLIFLIEDKMFQLYGNDWENRVFDEQKLKNYDCSVQFKITVPQDIIISFCEDTDKYYSSTQKIISASLHNTKSRNTYKNRSFGFMYSFSPDEIVAMCPDDIQSLNITITNYTELLATVFQGIPLHTLVQRMKLSPIDLKPIYNLDEFKEKTVLYNEIVLRETAKPFGIFVFREKLQEVLSKLFSLVITMQLPLFVCNTDGSLDFIPYNKILSKVENSLEKMDF